MPDAANPSPQDGPACGRFEAGRHVLPVRVYYEDTDYSGSVYHASYLRFLERGRTEFLRAASVSQRDLHARGGLAFVVRRMSLDFLKPAHMDDVLAVATVPRDIRGASMTLAQEICRGEDLLLSAEVLVAAVRQGRAVRIPEVLRAALRPGVPHP